MMTTELHAQAVVWSDHGRRFAALVMEGESPDRANGGTRTDALHAVARAKGLHLTTDPHQVPLRPVGGWRIRVEPSGGITLEWPRFHPLLLDTPVQLPNGWLEAASEYGIVLVFAGYGLGLHEHATDGHAHTIGLLQRVAEDGALAAGAVAFTGPEPAAARLDGTTGRPRFAAQHRWANAAGGHRREPNPRWWSRAMHVHHQPV